MTNIKFGTIGGGVMGEALLSRLIAQKVYLPSEILVSDPQLQRRQFLTETYGIGTTASNLEALVVSILAGVPLSKLEPAFPGRGVLRVMPNTPATVGAGMSAIAPGKLVQPADLELVKRIFQAVGEVVEVPESMLDAVTGLSGSGPGYVAILIEALTDGG